jgi:hypothetical protein
MKTRVIITIFFVAFLVTIIVSTSSKATINNSNTFDCYWLASLCPDGTFREVCCRTGNGHLCTCGSVTRSCPEIGL